MLLLFINDLRPLAYVQDNAVNSDSLSCGSAVVLQGGLSSYICNQVEGFSNLMFFVESSAKLPIMIVERKAKPFAHAISVETKTCSHCGKVISVKAVFKGHLKLNIALSEDNASYLFKFIYIPIR